jgi:predicted metal-dependent hydrolase
MRDWYIQQARITILPRVNEHAQKLGVVFNRARIVDNRYRWGSCTVKDNVNFNWGCPPSSLVGARQTRQHDNVVPRSSLEP